MDPVAMVKSALEAMSVPVSAPIVWVTIAMAALFLLAGTIASVRTIAEFWPGGLGGRVTRRLSRLRLRSPIFVQDPAFEGRPRAIAYPMWLWMSYRPAEGVYVHCRAAIYGMDRTVESPTELELVLPNGLAICRLTFHGNRQPQTVEPWQWRAMSYEGVIRADDLPKIIPFIRQTRGAASIQAGVRGLVRDDEPRLSVQFWPPQEATGSVPLMTAHIDEWNSFETNHLAFANTLLERAMVFAGKIVTYGRATDPSAHAAKLVEPDFVNEVDGWSENVQAFWTRSRVSP
jgi:hypothetical protein